MTSDCSNHADAYCYKTFRCNQKYRCGLLPAFRRSFSLSARVSVTGKSFLQLRYRDSYHAGSYCHPDRVISGTTATHGLCTDCPGPSEPSTGLCGLRRHTAISSAFRAMSFVIRDCIDQPIILRENRSTTTARYNQPS